ncbi:hypothetical protein BKD30_10360 [Tersicoccus phoenicis]|uniref:RES domain-containing protein n=1 Tax=Tersicoccus phoenicis TaxID=554083 RepID=A0A1R1L8D1_9MICC|nr:hypothetical protein [Tersicoccus phoenicis]OMH23784.1 hypothetical protein BKD30_10360 [Tersicoccus phoenicis]
MIPDPPEPFEPEVFTLSAGSPMYRVAGSSRAANAFNPGVGGATRFAFFGDPAIPVLYAAEGEVAAVRETLDLAIDPAYARVFAAGPDLDWLVDLCTPLHVEVLIH